MPGDFRLAVRRPEPGHCRITVAGELDVATAPRLRTVLHWAVTCHPRTTLDVSGLRFCDCAGLNVLLYGLRRAREHGADLRLDAVPGHLERLLRFTGTRHLFPGVDAAAPAARADGDPR